MSEQPRCPRCLRYVGKDAGVRCEWDNSVGAPTRLICENCTVQGRIALSLERIGELLEDIYEEMRK